MIAVASGNSRNGSPTFKARPWTGVTHEDPVNLGGILMKPGENGPVTHGNPVNIVVNSDEGSSKIMDRITLYNRVNFPIFFVVVIRPRYG